MAFVSLSGGEPCRVGLVFVCVVSCVCGQQPLPHASEAPKIVGYLFSPSFFFSWRAIPMHQNSPFPLTDKQLLMMSRLPSPALRQRNPTQPTHAPQPPVFPSSFPACIFSSLPPALPPSLPPSLQEYDETDSASPAHTNSPSTSEGGGSKGFKKRAWTVTEDGTLRDLVEQHGAKDWNYISSQLSHRSAKQCCERWHNYLKPDIRKDAWCTQEDQIILDYHHAFCNKWSKIAEFLPGRTGNAVKNRFYCLMRRDRKNAGAAAGATAGGASPSPTAGGGGAGGGGEMLMPHHGGGRPPLSPHHMQQQQQQQHLQQQQQQQQQQLQLQQLQQGFHGHLQHLPPGHAPSLGLPILTTTVDAQGNHHTQLANGTSIPSSSSSSSSSSGSQQQQQQQQQQPRHPQQQQQQQQQLHYTHSLQSSPTGGQTDIPPWGPSWTPPTTTSTGHHHQQQQQNNISSSGSSSGSSGSSSSGGGGGNAVFFGGNAAHGQHEGEGGGGTYFPHSAYPHHTGTPTEFRFTAAGAQRPTIHLGRGGGGGGQQQQQQQHQHQHQMQFMPMLIPSSASHSNDGGRGGGGGGGEGGDAIMVESNSNQKGGKS